MRKHILYILISVLAVSCVLQSKYDEEMQRNNILSSRVDSLSACILENNNLIATLRDSISVLSYPAGQRYNSAQNFVQAEDFANARKEIEGIQRVFPKSIEADKCPQLIAAIEKREAEIKAEQERIKALGFKVFKDNYTIKREDSTYSFSQFTFGRTFTFDYCPDVDEYWYRTADKNNTYLVTTMSLTSKKNYAFPPSIYACKIVDGKLRCIGYFSHEYAAWSSYGAKIGNYSDSSHDFSKVNTVRYKYGAEISLEDSKNPIIVLVPKDNNASLNDCTPEKLNESFYVVCIINRGKLK